MRDERRAPTGGDEQVSALGDIPDPGVLSVRLPGGVQVCLVRCGENVAAFHDECPHNGMPLSAGEVVDGCVLECAWHGARFDASNGAVLQGPAEENLTAYRVVVRDGRVFVGDRVA